MSSTNSGTVTVGGKAYTWSEGLARWGELVASTPSIAPSTEVLYLAKELVEANWLNKGSPDTGTEAELFARVKKFYGGAYGFVGGRPAGLPRPQKPTPHDKELVKEDAEAAEAAIALKDAIRVRDGTPHGSEQRAEAQRAVDRAEEDFRRPARRALKLRHAQTAWRHAHEASS